MCSICWLFLSTEEQDLKSYLFSKILTLVSSCHGYVITHVKASIISLNEMSSESLWVAFWL